MSCQLMELHFSSDFGVPDGGSDDQIQESTDIIAYVKENDVISKYSATAFTYDEISAQRMRNRRSGDYLNGTYFFKNNLLIVENCNRSTLEAVVNHLIQEGDFLTVFNKL